MCWHYHFFIRNQQLLLYQYKYRLHFNAYFLIFLTLPESLKVVLTNTVEILMMSAEFTTLGLLKRKVFWNKDHDVINPVHDVKKKVFSCNSNYIVHVVMWPKLGNSSIIMRKVTITSILYEFDQKKQFFEGYSLFKFNNLGLKVGMALKFYKNVAKGLKWKVKKFFGLVPTGGW